MKKNLIFLILIAFLCSCVSTPITEYNYSKNKRPMTTSWTWLTGFIPGLTQLVNKEYLEAIIYATTFFIPTIYAQTMYVDDPDNPDYMIPAPGKEAQINILMGIASVPLIWSYADGVVSTSIRNNQWDIIAKERGEYKPRASFKRIDIAKLRYGMTRDEILSMFPRPNDINTSRGKWGAHEQWVYYRSKHIGDEVYLYFENGVLTSWQY